MFLDLVQIVHEYISLVVFNNKTSISLQVKVFLVLNLSSRIEQEIYKHCANLINVKNKKKHNELFELHQK